MKSIKTKLLLIGNSIVFSVLCTAFGIMAPNVAENHEAPIMFGHDFSWTNYASDYYVPFSFSNLNTDRCNCSESRRIRLAKTRFRSGSNWLTVNDVAASGSFNFNMGPSFNSNVYVSVEYHGTERKDGCLFCGGPLCSPKSCYKYTDLNNVITPRTSSIYAPNNVSATDGDFSTKIDITWDKGTDIPNNLHSYKIYRNNTLIATVSGSTRSYSDTGLTQGDSYTYRVRTWTNSFRGQTYESYLFDSGATDSGSTLSANVQASDGEFYNRTKITWEDLSSIADDIKIERKELSSGQVEELDIVNKNTTTYNDNDGIPGFNYEYIITPISGSTTFLPESDVGYSKPNGTIKGHVKSKFGAGVADVEIRVNLIDNIPNGAVLSPPNCTATYCATTDASGYYEIRDIYYHEEAEFEIKPVKGGAFPHEFTPDSLRRILSLNAKVQSGVDFQDETVFSVLGKVTFPDTGTGIKCGIEGVEILINDEQRGIFTDPDGTWSFAIQDEADYNFRPVFKHHTFISDNLLPSIDRFINGDNLDLNFTDTTTDSIQVRVQGGCGDPIAESVEITVTSPNNCYSQVFLTDASGNLIINDLPATKYTVVVTNVNNALIANEAIIEDQIGNKPLDFDLTVRDTANNITNTDSMVITPEVRDTLPNGAIVITPADTMMLSESDSTKVDVEPFAEFIYRSPITITTNWTDAGGEVFNCGGDEKIVLEQGVQYTLTFEVKESLGNECFVDSGALEIYDFVADLGAPISIPIKNGLVTYTFVAGEPNIAESLVNNHEKLLYVVPKIGFQDPVPVEYWPIVTGVKSQTPSFFTRTPEIPMIVLHDPPGDNSYAYIEKNTTFTNYTYNEVLVGGQAGVFADLLIGAKVLTPFSSNGAGTVIKFEAVGGRDNFDRDATVTTITFNEEFRTSDAPNLSGNEGDIYIGAAMNHEYSLADELKFENCMFETDVVPTVAVTGFATTFVYTEQHVRNTLLPTLTLLKEELRDDRPLTDLTEEEVIEYNSLVYDSLLWNQILDKNELARDEDAVFKENISFSAGAPVGKSTSIDSFNSVSYEYNAFVNIDFAIGAKIDNESGAWFDSEFGVTSSFRYSSNVTTGDDTSRVVTTGYVLDDDDIGDFYSVDVLEDTSYAVPSFRLKLGTTSCPHEENTQARDLTQIGIFPPIVNNVPLGEAATFTAALTNISESRETREYAARVISTTNPDGAIVRLGGQLINNGPANFFLDFNQTSNIVLTVEKGPLASNYENIGIMFYPPCEYELWQDNGNITSGDTAWISVNFESECTNVSIVEPEDGFIVNQNNNDELDITIGGYDLNNPFFESLTLQYRKEGEGWVNQTTVNAEDLIGIFEAYTFDVSNLEDGDYRLRVAAYCGPEIGYSYSTEVKGTIDRMSLAPFGMPTPADGFLRIGQEVSVSYDKFINCNLASYPHNITLMREDTGDEIPVTVQCFENKIILQTDPPLIDRTDLNGVMLVAHVDSLRDLVGNIQKYDTDWSFLANVNPVSWNQDTIFFSSFVGEPSTFEAQLDNLSLINKIYYLDTGVYPTLVDYPSWLNIPVQSSSILPEGSYGVEMQIDNDLRPGIYEADITAVVDSFPVTFHLIHEKKALPIDWEVKEEDYESTSSYVLQFSIDEDNDIFSTDERDVIGAFKNGETRGVANIEYVPEFDIYRAFLTLHGNDDDDPEVSDIFFRIWDASTGIEYAAKERTSFKVNTVTGSLGSPEVLHALGFFQSIPLKKGWNWISFNSILEVNNVVDVFGPLTSSNLNNDIIVKSLNDGMAVYTQATGWNGELETIDPKYGYLVHLSTNPDTLEASGFPILDPLPIAVQRGWNWIGYPKTDITSVDDYLQDLPLRANDLVMSQTEFARYIVGQSTWIGSLDFMEPNKGYKLNVRRAGNILASRQVPNSEFYDIDLEEMDYDMTMVLKVDTENSNIDPENNLLCASILGDCVGIGEFRFVESLNEYRVFMMIHGDEVLNQQSLEFSLIDKDANVKLKLEGDFIDFSPDKIEGYTDRPHVLNFTGEIEEIDSKEFFLEQNRPNPFSDISEIEFYLPSKEFVKLEIYDSFGRLVKTLIDEELPKGNYKYAVRADDFSNGIYFYHINAGKYKASKSMSIIR